MGVDLLKIERFYASSLGQYVLSKLTTHFSRIAKPHHKVCIASASLFACADIFKKNSRILSLQTQGEQRGWPKIGQDHYVQIQKYWPYRSEDVDLVVMMHDLEFSNSPQDYLAEAWRVLKGEGDLVIVFPNREGRWARLDNTPFGHGHPYSLRQIKRLLQEAHFEIESNHDVLYFPPYEPKTTIGKFFRNIVDKAYGLCLYHPGIYMIVAKKHVHAPIGGGVTDIVAKMGKALQPRPAATAKGVASRTLKH